MTGQPDSVGTPAEWMLPPSLDELVDEFLGGSDVTPAAVRKVFYDAVRDGLGPRSGQGCYVPEEVVQSVLTEMQDRVQRWADATAQEMITLTRSQPKTALAIAAEVIRRELAPDEERGQRRAEGVREGQRTRMTGKPVTPNQIWKLKQVGYSGPAPTDRLEASNLIDACLSGRA